ncbi:MAG TPA: carbohydrate-binding protein [Acidimicrobiales bacterium]|nr:carbohydrate-binding protein [Acidimicrobiales bacterium]
MPTRRDVLKGGGGALVAGMAGMAGSPARARLAASLGASGSATPAPAVPAPAVTAFRPGGAGPLYWSTYGWEFANNAIIPESVWKENVDWVASTFAGHGYTMVCTDGWIDDTQTITPNGYIVSQADDWEHDWAWWSAYLAAKGMQLGIYYNPLWVTKSAVTNPAVTVVGRPDVTVADIVNPGDDFDGGGRLQWVDATRDGAEEYVKGYVEHFRQVGAVFLRIDFLAWYETGFDQSEGTVGRAHGRDAYLQALAWMREAAGTDMQLSLVMPNLFDHGSGERLYGDLVRIDNDASFGAWGNLSGGRQGWQPEWSQWNNPFLGFTGFADISGRGQMILDGDPLLMASFADDTERKSAVNLFTMAGAPIAIGDFTTTMGGHAHVLQNPEVLALRRAGLVGKPIFSSSHGFEYDPSSRDPERWVGQLPDGSWAVGLFNRQDGPKPRSKAITFANALGTTAPAAVRDLWAHKDLGTMTGYKVELGPHASVLLSVVPQGPPRYMAEVGAWAGSARFDKTFAGHSGLGYVTGLDTVGSSVALAVEVSAAGPTTLQCHVANATGTTSELTVAALDPVSGAAHGSAVLSVPSTPAWTTWQTVPVTLTMAAGVNLVVCSVADAGQGGVNLDAVTLS